MHAWSDDTELDETLSAVDHAVATGRARYVGISNYSGWQTGRAVTWQQGSPGRAPLVSTQMEYSLLQRGIEREVLPAAQALGLGLLPWSPLGARRAHRQVPRRARRRTPARPPRTSRGSSSGSSTTAAAASSTPCAPRPTGSDASPLEVALAWVRDAPGVTAPVVGARTAAQLRASLHRGDG